MKKKSNIQKLIQGGGFESESRVYGVGGVSPTLGTGHAMSEVKILVKEATNKGYTEVKPGGVLNVAFPDSETRRGRVINNGETAPTLDCSCEIGQITDDMRIRKLTPKECFRLQGFPDEYFERAASVCQDSQLYKQAGNSVTVNVIYEIARRL